MAVRKVKQPTKVRASKVVSLVQQDDPYRHLDHTDGLGDEERQRLHARIRAGLDEINAGRGISAEDIIEELKAL